MIKQSQSWKIYKKFSSLKTNTKNSMKNISEQINKIENKLDKSDDDKNKNQIQNGNLSKKLMDETIEPIESWT